MPARYRLLTLITCLLLITFADARAASVMVMPASATVSPGQSFLFSAAIVGASNTGVTWSMSPALGTISNGFYTAPATVTIPETVMLTASSLGNAGLSGTAVITLMPAGAGTVTAPSSSTVSLTPSTASLSAGQAAVFTLNGASGATWSISPMVGTIANGFYQAPSSLSSSQTVTVTAVSTSDATQRATATISLVAPGAPASSGGFVYIMPSSASLTAGQVAGFSAGVSGGVNAGVSWSLSPAVGIISNGYYTAPSNIPFSQTVTLKATSLANPSLTNSVPIFLVGNSPGGSPPAAPPPPVTPTGISLTPMSISMLPLQNALFTVSTTGGLSPSASWSLVPSIGSVSNGIYSAPASVTTQTTVTLIATSTSDPTKTASAAIVLQPNASGPVSVSLSPSSASLTSGQIAQFSATVSGASNTSVTWSLSPAIGSISNGTYAAPSGLTAQQAITVTATSVADPTKSATASVMLVPVTITLAPATISLGAGKSAQFTASVMGASNTSVTWSITPAVGSIANGLYLAPTSVTTSQNVTVKATSVADPTKFAQATVSLAPAGSPSSIAVSPTQASLSASQTQQFSASVGGGLGGGGGVSVTWSISPAVGSITQAGLYTAPSTVSVQQNIIVTATGSSASNSATVTLNPAGQAPPPGNPPPPPQGQPSTTTVQLPVEVMGAAGTTVPVTVSVPAGSNLSGQVQLSLQIHGLKYETEASVQVNGGAWTPINTSTVTMAGQAASLGGIGGGFATLQLTLNLPSGSIVNGQNTLAFKFNGTDGITSGYRILSLNILDPSGNQLLSSSGFSWDDPSTWQPPLNDATDIQAGQNLWKTASLTTPAGAIVAHCGDCHTQDGRDLKYFNYSNFSIRARSMFHGLTQQQGDQIASYIRSLNVPAPASARPWNPPYQPGPGLDSQPVQNWAAGAGLSAVLDNDTDMVQYLMPGGSAANFQATGFLNQRETPIVIQLPDWNRWLPTIHPLDAFGPSFLQSALYQGYLSARSTLSYQNSTAYAQSLGPLQQWIYHDTLYVGLQIKPQSDPAWTDPHYVQEIYSARLWSVVKNFEIFQEFGLEGMPQAAFGPQAESRAWYSQVPFFASPNMCDIPDPSPGLGNGLQITFVYLSQAWYQLQLILNDGNGTFAGTTPIDFPYVYGFVQGLGFRSLNTPPHGTGALMIEWMIKALQDSQNNVGPDNSNNAPWTYVDNDPSVLVKYPDAPTLWNDLSASQRITLLNTYLTAWFNKISTFTPQQWYNGGQTTAATIPDPTQNEVTNMANRIAFMIPQFLYYGVDRGLMTNIANWAATIWPNYNWSLTLASTCAQSTQGFVACTPVN